MNNGTLRLYRKRSDGVVNIAEFHPSMFEDKDTYNDAVDLAYLIGYSKEYPIDYGIPQGED